MAYSDVASRIGAIQGTLATITGSRPASTSSKAPAPMQDSQVSAGAGSSSAGIGTGIGGGILGNTSTSEFTKILQDALEPALKTVAQSNPKTAEPVASPARGATKTGPVEVEALKESTDGKATGTDVVREARKYLGVPYVWGGNDPKIGLDCSSFVQHTFRDLGVDLPRVARDQAKVGTEIPSLAQAKPGDLIVTRNGAHIGIYLGENKMIHAPRPGEQVSIRKLFETDAQIMTIRRIVPAESPAPTATKTVAESQVREASARAAELTASAQRAAFNSVVKDS